MATAPNSTESSPLWRSLVAGCALGALAACGVEIGRMALTRNTHVVVPGRLYRTAQMKPERLAEYVEANGIRTVVNLRGRSFDAFYPDECAATQWLGVSQEDITTSANWLPSPGEIRRLIEVFDNSEHPILIHCRQGADRTGLAAAVYLMLYTDATYEVARAQCSPRYGHLRIHTAAAMDDFFDQYEAWLASSGEAHSPAVFRRWATREYAPIGSSRLELLNSVDAVPTDTPRIFRVRAYNNSHEPWEFKAGSAAGVHAWYQVLTADATIVFGDRAGFVDATVAPGGFIDIDLPVPALPGAGTYRLYVDLSKRNIDFVKYGSEPLIHDWEARDPARLRGR